MPEIKVGDWVMFTRQNDTVISEIIRIGVEKGNPEAKMYLTLNGIISAEDVLEVRNIRDKAPSDFLDTDISELELSVSGSNALRALGISTIRDVLATDRLWYLRRPSMSNKSVKDLCNAIGEYFLGRPEFKK